MPMREGPAVGGLLGPSAPDPLPDDPGPLVPPDTDPTPEPIVTDPPEPPAAGDTALVQWTGNLDDGREVTVLPDVLVRRSDGIVLQVPAAHLVKV
jgi:hypothetical protein